MAPLLYRRLVPIRALSIATYVVEDIVRRMVFLIIPASNFTCLPVQDFCEPEATSSCGINSLRVYLGNTISTVLTDMTILCVSIPLAWNLQMSTLHMLKVRWFSLQEACKLLLSLGTSTPRGLTMLIEIVHFRLCVTSIIRLPSLVRNTLGGFFLCIY